jgi:Nuclease A inhibitor-like protein
MMTSDKDLLDTLKKASAGLQYTSESDYPFEVFSWPLDTLTPKKLLAQKGYPKDTAIQLGDFDKFFAQAIEEKDWYGPKEKATVAQYQQLVKLLRSELNDIQVYRVGEIELEVYIIGKTPEGALAGLSTKVVET